MKLQRNEQNKQIFPLEELMSVPHSAIIEKTLKQVFQPLVEIEIIKSKITLSSKDVEKFYGIPESTLRTWRNRKKGPKFHQSEKGCPVIYTHEEVKDYLLRNPKGC